MFLASAEELHHNDVVEWQVILIRPTVYEGWSGVAIHGATYGLRRFCVDSAVLALD